MGATSIVPKRWKIFGTPGLNNTGIVCWSTILGEHVWGIKILRPKPWKHFILQKCQIHIFVHFNSLFNENQGSFPSICGHPSPDHDRLGFLPLKHSPVFQSNVFLVFSQYSVILNVMDALNSEKLLISEQYRELHATPDLIQQNFTSSQPFSFCGI